MLLTWDSSIQKEQNWLPLFMMDWMTGILSSFSTGNSLTDSTNLYFAISLKQFLLCLPSRQYSRKTRVCTRHCRTLFAKQVFPILYRPGNTFIFWSSRWFDISLRPGRVLVPMKLRYFCISLFGPCAYYLAFNKVLVWRSVQDLCWQVAFTNF